MLLNSTYANSVEMKMNSYVSYLIVEFRKLVLFNFLLHTNIRLTREHVQNNKNSQDIR